ncbi:FtsX-like permease family protein [Streptomyces sp. SBT349]|uniref:FtsX-like permease family protein n=1 Tax=Streptomyces sp. SBT349 TaxID=1580539 RepID=UPI00066E607C|nr:ABC transporter permease [Streptomyces sp. SBT349]
MSAWTTWRLALRVARRDALRAKGRSALVVAMIALPILGVTAADVAFRSGELSREEEYTRLMGRADAWFEPQTGGQPVQQAPARGYAHWTPDGAWEDARDRPVGETAAALEEALPPGTEVLAERRETGIVHSRSGLMDTRFREIDAAHPLTGGMLTLLRGHFPRESGEVAATQAFLDESGLRVGSELRVEEGTGSYRITGAYELPGGLGDAEVLGSPGALLPLPEGARVPFGESGPARFLVDVPDGGVTWDMVMAANERGLAGESKDVIASPPPDADVPLFASGEVSPGEYAPYEGEADPMVVVVAVTVVSLVILEICLLAGPAFAVGARRSRRQLGLIGANGGDRRHLRAVMLSSGVVLGAVAAVIGVVGGVALTLAAHPLLENQTGARLGAWDFRVPELAGIAGLAVLVGLLAALIPAINASRGSVLASLAGRRGVRRTGRALPVVGAVALAAGATLAIVGGLTMDSAVAVSAGSILAELGLVALTPALVGAFGRLSRFLPLSGRLALRDATRNRGRTAPAVAAVLAAVAGTVAVATVMASADAEDRSAYIARLPAGTVHISADTAETEADIARAGTLAERELPVDLRADAGTVRPGAPGCDPWGGGETACGQGWLVTPPEQRCLLWSEDPVSLSAEERRRWLEDPRCDSGGEMMIAENALTVAGPELLSVVGVTGATHREAAEALERGEALVFGDQYVDEDGEVTLQVFEEPPQEWNGDNSPAGEPGSTVTFTAHRVDADGYGLAALVAPETAEAADLAVASTGVYLSTTRTPSDGEEQALNAALDEEFGSPPWLFVEDGYESDVSTGLLILALGAMIITLGAAGIATGLAQADSEADLATLASVGATPRVRRTLSGLQCGLIAAMGVLLGAVSGLVPAIGLRLAEHRSAVDSWQEAWDEGWEAGPRPELFLELPWATFAQLIVVVPLVACLLAALLTRSRIHLARRTG